MGHEHVIEAAQQRLDQDPRIMRRRRETVEQSLTRDRHGMRFPQSHSRPDRCQRQRLHQKVRRAHPHLERAKGLPGLPYDD
jgi:hypothetical protein